VGEGKKGRVNLCTVEDYKDEWRRFNHAKERFDDVEDKIIQSYRRNYMLKYKGMGEHEWYKIPKIYFNYLKDKGVKDLTNK